VKKTLALLAIIPLTSFLIAPLAIACAGYNVEISVYCDTLNPSSASLTYAGHTVSVACWESSEPAHYYIHVTSTSKYTATLTSEGASFSSTGKFGPNWGSLGNEQVSPSGYGTLEWCISSPVGVGCND
jgi:hypothetical protein